MRFSIIVPVYNTEQYLRKCLDSLVNQTIKDIEIIVVNDGSPDNSQAIIDEYVAKYPEKIRAFIKENGGLSDARNFGIERAKGDYLLFLDSDDYISVDCLKEINEVIEKNSPDIIGFELRLTNGNGETLGRYSRPYLEAADGEEAIIKLVDSKECFETACGYAYRREYWESERFAFIKGIYHEDFALIPLVILRAKTVSFINSEFYQYFQNEDSIMNYSSPEKEQKKLEDTLIGYDFLVSEYAKRPARNKYAGKMYLAYAANSVISRLKNLNGEAKKHYRKELIKRRVADNIISNNLKRKLRKLFLRLKYKI